MKNYRSLRIEVEESYGFSSFFFYILLIRKFLTIVKIYYIGVIMRYFYEKPKIYRSSYGTTYECNHPVYNKCTLFEIKKKGLAVIQKRYHKDSKYTYWTEIDPWLTDELYLHPKFKSFFDERSGEQEGNLLFI